MNQEPKRDDAWQRIVERLDRMGARPQDCLSLMAGDRVVVAFCGDPWAYEAAWHDERQQWVPIHRSPQPVEPALRIRINCYVPAIGRMKWWEVDTCTFQVLRRMRDRYGLDKWLFEIEAVDVSDDGASGVYAVSPEAALDVELLARIGSVPCFEWGDDDGETLDARLERGE